MILPIYAYGQPVLRKEAIAIGPDYPELSQLISNMWETMSHAEGIGLAAPQIGLSIRIFIIDTTIIKNDDEAEDEGVKQVFINAQVVEETGKEWAYEEGCLSIPEIRGDVSRPDTITLSYMDEHFEEHTKTFTGMNARVIQHEYDHINGILFVEHLKPLKKRLIKKRLENVRKGHIEVDYRMKFSKTK